MLIILPIWLQVSKISQDGSKSLFQTRSHKMITANTPHAHTLPNMPQGTRCTAALCQNIIIKASNWKQYAIQAVL